MKPASVEKLRDSFIRLRNDALDRNMQGLAIVYGWSAIRLSGELISKRVLQMRDEAARIAHENRKVPPIQ